ncbi:phosphopantetheine-binding protein [Streptomyces sp. NPDC001941]|uniref:acyl carrier protein n=1 Tax=Streptomyces sp. NPDC001941 TaxID=3154659 RepID=UPI00332F6FDF
MSTQTQTLALVQHLISLITERPAEEILPGQRLYEDLQMDSLQITELAQKIETETGKSIDEDLLAAEGATVALCVDVTDAAS